MCDVDLSSMFNYCRSVSWSSDNDFLGVFAKLRKVTIIFVMSVRPHETIRLPLEGISLNLILAYFSRIRRENSIVLKIAHEYPVF